MLPFSIPPAIRPNGCSGDSNPRRKRNHKHRQHYVVIVSLNNSVPNKPHDSFWKWCGEGALPSRRSDWSFLANPRGKISNSAEDENDASRAPATVPSAIRSGCWVLGLHATTAFRETSFNFIATAEEFGPQPLPCNTNKSSENGVHTRILVASQLTC